MTGQIRGRGPAGILSGLLLSLLTLCLPVHEARSEVPPLHFIEFTTGPATNRPLPLVIAIHGLGDNPSNFSRLYRGAQLSARWILPRGPLVYGRGYSWFPVKVPVGPNDPDLASDLRQATQKVVALIKYLRASRPGLGRPVVTGFSQGGMLSFALAAHHGGVIGASVPVAGVLPPDLYPQKDPKTVVFALHGTADTVVPYAAAMATMKAFRRVGAHIQWAQFPGVGHYLVPSMTQRMFEFLARATTMGTRKPVGQGIRIKERDVGK